MDEPFKQLYGGALGNTKSLFFGSTDISCVSTGGAGKTGGSGKTGGAGKTGAITGGTGTLGVKGLFTIFSTFVFNVGVFISILGGSTFLFFSFFLFFFLRVFHFFFLALILLNNLNVYQIHYA